MRSVIIVSTQSQITRPEGSIKKEFDNVIKADQFRTYTQDIMNSTGTVMSIGKLVSLETLETLMESLVAQHKPISIDYAAKFGLETFPATPSTRSSSGPVIEVAINKPEAKPVKAYNCAACKKTVELKVARFCWFNKDKMGGHILCRSDQNLAGIKAADLLAQT